jgi:aminopeptidase-like protein
MATDNGRVMYDLAARMFPLCRSITGNGFRESLEMIREVVPDIKVHEVPTGTPVFDWTVPKEWNIRGGGIYRLNGDKVIDFRDSNLHIIGYSLPIDEVVSREELLEHVYTQPDQPDWIPYVTSYYKERWGFCMSENQKQTLTDDEYHVVIDSTLEDGSLTYGELIIPGETADEILITTYLCHPSMANDELSGPVVVAELMKYVMQMERRRYTYRFVINPETIGAITYISRNLAALRQHVKAGFVLSCVGDDRTYSYIATKYGDTLADRVMQNVLHYHYPGYKKYSFLDRGSDERQYGAAGVNLPVCGLCRSKYTQYPEYHTSADNMDLISPEGLQGAYDVMVKVIRALEHNDHYTMTVCCEPQLGKRGLYPTISYKGSHDDVNVIRDFTAYADGRYDLIGISDLIGAPTDALIALKEKLLQHSLIKVV